MPTSAPTRRRSKLDPLKVYQLRVNNRLSYNQIADQLDCSKSSVIECLQRFSQTIHSPDDKSAYEAIRVQAMTTVEEKLMASLTDPDKIAKASLNNVAYAFQQIHTARRLEEGKATEQVSVLTRMLTDAHDGLYRREKQTQDSESNEIKEI